MVGKISPYFIKYISKHFNHDSFAMKSLQTVIELSSYQSITMNWFFHSSHTCTTGNTGIIIHHLTNFYYFPNSALIASTTEFWRRLFDAVTALYFILLHMNDLVLREKMCSTSKIMTILRTNCSLKMNSSTVENFHFTCPCCLARCG